MANLSSTKSCWEAIGQARIDFEELQIKIKEYLDNTCAPLWKDVVWSLYMVGRSRETSLPTITFISSDSLARKRLRNIILESQLLAQYPGFITMDIDRPPGCRNSVMRTLGPFSHDDPDSSSAQKRQPKVLVSSNGLMGASIFLDGLKSSAIATVGGLIQSQGKIYLTTVAHPFEEHWTDNFSSEPSPEAYVFDIDDADFDDDADDELVSRVTSGGSNTSQSAQHGTSSHSPHSEGDKWAAGVHEYGAHRKSSSPISIPGIQSRELLTRTESNALAATDKDEKISHEYQTKAKASTDISDILASGSLKEATIIPKGPIAIPSTPVSPYAEDVVYDLIGPALYSSRGDSTPLDYSLFELSATMSHMIEVPATSTTEYERPLTAPTVSRSTEVVVCTTNGMLPARLLATSTFKHFANGQPSQRLWTVIVEGNLQKGICGSWVVDTQTREVFGHVIAGAPQDGLAYIIPFCEILDDLNKHSGNDWTFTRIRLPVMNEAVAGSSTTHAYIDAYGSPSIRNEMLRISSIRTPSPVSFSSDIDDELMSQPDSDSARSIYFPEFLVRRYRSFIRLSPMLQLYLNSTEEAVTSIADVAPPEEQYYTLPEEQYYTLPEGFMDLGLRSRNDSLVVNADDQYSSRSKTSSLHSRTYSFLDEDGHDMEQLDTMLHAGDLVEDGHEIEYEMGFLVD